MQATGAAQRLTAEDVDVHIDPAALSFASTAELEPLQEIVGQPRALRAIELGLGVRGGKYNIYVAGMSGTGKMETIRRALSERVRREPPPPDWIYVNNFDEPESPRAISLPSGRGVQVKRDVDALVQHLVENLPKAFRDEDFSKEKKRLGEIYEAQSRKIQQELEEMGRERDLALQQLPDGRLLFIPTKEGQPMTPEEVQQLSEEEIERIDKQQEELAAEAPRLLERQRDISQKMAADVREVERNFAEQFIKPLIERIRQKYESEELGRWLASMEQHLVQHLDRFKHKPREAPPALAALMGAGGAPDREEQFLEYQVNVVVDNSRGEGAPVIVEDAPNYKNLFGAIERLVDRFGKLVTNFTRIKAGSFLRASGGYLVFNLEDALTEPLVYKELKRAIKSGRMQIETYDPFALFSTTAMRPEPIPVRTKLVVIGNPLLYHLLYLYDDDFREIFKVKADFDTEMDRSADAQLSYARFVRKLSEKEGLLPFEPSGVVELIRFGARYSGDKEKLATEFSDLADVIREADYWTRQDGASAVTGAHVRTVLDERVIRSNLIAEKIRALIDDGTILIDLANRAVGQVNGLAVANLGDYAFGRPARVSASTGVGAAGIINIERESKLSGRTHDKGVLILEGYLRNRYAASAPIALSASLAFEQSYGPIDGDSASSAELYCLLSAVSGVPLRQDIAVTGSVNQHGQVQAIGGVNEKIEGFYDVCKLKGLTGEQGVCIPASNVKNLVLRHDVVQAIGEGTFHVWAVETIDQGIELLTGKPAGSVDQEGTLHYEVSRRLGEMAAALKEQRSVAAERETLGPEALPTAPDPRPPLPGRDGS
jgi:predicted ATP-dependent protease